MQFLQASDLSMLALTNNLHNSIVSNEDLWRYFYKRDFNSSLPQSSSISPQQLYQIRMMNDFMNLEREKSFLHLSYIIILYSSIEIYYKNQKRKLILFKIAIPMEYGQLIMMY